MKVTKVKFGENLKLQGMPVIFNKSGAGLIIGNNLEYFINRFAMQSWKLW
jgi:hypothetical protein